MNQIASLVAIALFVVFASLGAQRIVFNEVMSTSATRLGFSKQAYRIIGVIEVVLAIVMIASVKGTGVLKTVAIIDGIALMGMAGGETVANLRKQQPSNYLWPVLALLALSAVEVVARLIG